MNIRLSKPLQATSLASWSSDLNFPDAVHRIITGFNSTCTYVTEFWHEQQFKIMHRAYIPFLSSLQQTPKRQCPLCDQERPTLLHRLWTCPHISAFWNQVENFTFQVTGRTPTKDIFPILFGYLGTPISNRPITQPTSPQHNKAWLSTCFMSS